jgi:hypothetical protein
MAELLRFRVLADSLLCLASVWLREIRLLHCRVHNAIVTSQRGFFDIGKS